MFRASLYFLVLFFAFFVPGVFAEPALEVSLQKSEITAGETTELLLQIQWPKSEASYAFAIPEIPLQNLAVTNQAESQETFLKGEEEWTRKTFSYELTPKGPGEGEMGAFKVTYVNPQSGTQGEFQVSGLKAKIIPESKTRNILPWILVLSAVSGSAGFGVWLVKRVRPKKAVPQTSPQEIAVTMIKSRIQSADLASGQALAEIDREFREFLKEIYGFNPAAFSEQEAAEKFKAKGILLDELKTLQRILAEVREIKYTSKPLTESEFQILKRDILTFIDSKQICTFSSPN